MVLWCQLAYRVLGAPFADLYAFHSVTALYRSLITTCVCIVSTGCLSTQASKGTSWLTWRQKQSSAHPLSYTPIVAVTNLRQWAQRSVQDDWVTLWAEKQSNKFREVKATVADWSSSHHRPFKGMECILPAFRLGHMQLTNAYLWDLAPPACPNCGVLFSVDLLIECPRGWSGLHLVCSPASLAEILWNSWFCV